MRISKDPMEPLRCWKELLFGERAFRVKKPSRLTRRRCVDHMTIGNGSHVVVN
jgi:hypothetical protein